ncbi:uncharacterized protein LODBEIA_P19450 [Lodderomyces beijingensis]|uniref:Uncharacterized protein n=1 Tax=Lodderomyces beijingensis TaxID=1775926 RepID=A0ABP0ZHU9_9ASCO
MSDLLDRFKDSRRSATFREPISSLYPRISGFDRETATTNVRRGREADTELSPVRRNGVRFADAVPELEPTNWRKKYGEYTRSPKHELETAPRSASTRDETSFAARMRKYEDLGIAGGDGSSNTTNKYTSRRRNSPSKFQSKQSRSSLLDSTTRPSKEIDSRSRLSLLRRASSLKDSPVSIDRYRISKPPHKSSPSDSKNGLLSKIFNFFQGNEDEEEDENEREAEVEGNNLRRYTRTVADEADDYDYDDFSHSTRKARTLRLKNRYDEDLDEVDAAISRSKQLERVETEKQQLEKKYRDLQREYKAVADQVEDERQEKTKLALEHKRVTQTYEARIEEYKAKIIRYEEQITELENELFNKNVQLDKFTSQSERKFKQQVSQIEEEYETKARATKLEHEKEVNELRDFFTKQVEGAKQRNHELEAKLESMDKQLFDTGFELKQFQRDLQHLTEKNSSIQLEISLRERFRQARTSQSDLNHLYAKSSHIENEIAKLEKRNHSSGKQQQLSAKDYQKTQTNIDKTVSHLNEMIDNLEFDGLADCEAYCSNVDEFLSNKVLEVENLISNLQLSTHRDNTQVILTEYLHLQRLLELCLKVLNVKQLVSNCKILKEFSNNPAIDVKSIYTQVKAEIL